jgi:predicted PurR-regulated permease PerM
MTDQALKKIWKFFFWSISVFLLLYLVYLLSDIIIILVVSILLAFIFNPFVTTLERRGFKRLPSTLIMFVGVGVLMYLVLSFFIPRFIFQMNQLIDALKDFSLHEQLIKVEKEIYSFLPFFSLGEISRRVERFISSQIVSSFDSISIILSSIVSIVAILVIVPFITFFLLKDNRKILQGIVQLMPNNYFEASYWVLKKVSIQLGRFVRGWIFDATFVGVTCGLGFYFIGIPNALPLGVIAGFGHLVPYLGPIIGGIPAAIISIIQFGDFSAIPYIIIVMSLVYTFDNGFVQPYVFSKSVDMHPIIIILLIITGSQLFGILGMLLAVPTAAVIRTTAKEVYFVIKNYKIAKL